MKQTIEIEVPEGKKAVWKDNKVIFENIELPKTWEEYCKNYNSSPKEAYIGEYSGVTELKNITENCERNSISDRNLLPSKRDAKAHLALMQLHRLRDCYRQGWIPKDKEDVYAVQRHRDGTYSVAIYSIYSAFLSFQYRDIAELFLTNFRDLIEEAGDLI